MDTQDSETVYYRPGEPVTPTPAARTAAPIRSPPSPTLSTIFPMFHKKVRHRYGDDSSVVTCLSPTSSSGSDNSPPPSLTPRRDDRSPRSSLSPRLPSDQSSRQSAPSPSSSHILVPASQSQFERPISRYTPDASPSASFPIPRSPFESTPVPRPQSSPGEYGAAYIEIHAQRAHDLRKQAVHADDKRLREENSVAYRNALKRANAAEIELAASRAVVLGHSLRLRGEKDEMDKVRRESGVLRTRVERLEVQLAGAQADAAKAGQELEDEIEAWESRDAAESMSAFWKRRDASEATSSESQLPLIQYIRVPIQKLEAMMEECYANSKKRPIAEPEMEDYRRKFEAATKELRELRASIRSLVPI